jgi:hypothetical protein
MTVLVAFYRPSTWWGWLIAGYQLMRGVKYWQLVHCEIMTPEGQYAYRINEVLHGSFDAHFEPVSCVTTVPNAPSEQYRLKASKFTHRLWGDFSPLSPFNGNHCVRYCKIVLGLKCRDNLPGQLCYYLETRDVQTTHHRD